MKYVVYSLSKRLSKLKTFHWLKKADIIIDFKNGHANKLIKRIHNGKIKKILWIHTGMPDFEKYMLNLDLSIYDQIVVLTDSFKEKLKARYPSLKDKIVRIYNPTNFKKMAHLVNEKLPLIEEDFFVHVSRLDIDKDIKTLIDAYNLFYQNQKTSLTPPRYFIS